MLQAKHPEAPAAQRRKVLLVGVEASVQGLVSTFLLTMGWMCTVVPNKEEAPVILQREAFDALVIDLGRSEANAEQVLLKIKQIRPSLGDRILAISHSGADRKMLELMERHDLVSLSPEGLLPQLWATLLELFDSSRSRDLPFRGMPAARIIFDSLRYPLVTGMRGLSPGPRQLAYQHKGTIIDVSIEFKPESGQLALAGQVLGGEGKSKNKNEDLSVLLVTGAGTVARTATNQFGEFYVECEPPDGMSLEIRLGERSWVSVPLGKMGCSGQRMLIGPES